MSRDSELADIVSLHKEWLTSDNKAGKRADLSGANLDGADLSNLDLSGAIIRGASLIGTNLSGCKLFHADFSDANLRGANFSGASMILTDFTAADLSRANLTNTLAPTYSQTATSNHDSISVEKQNRRGPTFRDANLAQANLTLSYCYLSDFSGANLESCCFSEANIEGANLSNNNLDSLNLSSCNAINANFSNSQLCNTDLKNTLFTGADMRGTNLMQSNICGANLRSASLESCKVDGIKYNRKTLFRGIRLEGCYGSSRFKRFADDQDYLEEFREAHPLSYFVWLTLTDCGRSMTRVALWTQAISIIFGLIYFALGQDSFEINNPDGLKWNLFTAIYYSVVTFTTLGFGDITPNTPFAAGIVIVEVAIGYVMLGILISILATKVARRS